jgi:hypothetical protein
MVIGGYQVEFIQDYIMRIIHEMVRMALKILFNITVDECEHQIEENQELSEMYNKLKFLIDNGNINEAENLLYADNDSSDKGILLIGILIYNYLNEFDDDFLESHDFSRQEVREGLETLLVKYGTTLD